MRAKLPMVLVVMFFGVMVPNVDAFCVYNETDRDVGKADIRKGISSLTGNSVVIGKTITLTPQIGKMALWV